MITRVFGSGGETMPGYQLRYRQVDALSPAELAEQLRWTYRSLGWQMGEIGGNGDGVVEVTGTQDSRRITIRVRPVRGAEKEVCIVHDDHVAA